MRNRIVRYLQKHPGISFRKRQLGRLMGLQKSEYRNFRMELRKLQEEGKLLPIRGGGYVWADSAATARGKLVLNRKGFGFLVVEDGDDIFVSSRNLKGAIHGDTIEVVLLPWAFGKRSEGHVIRVMERGTGKFIGTVTRQDGGHHLEIDPVTPKRGIQIVEPSPVQLSSGDVIVAEVQDWGTGRRPIRVKATKVIGSILKPEDDMKIVCHRFDLEPEFPKKVIRESEKFSGKEIEREIQDRVDLRGKTCITIDPADARDFDDALSLGRDKGGNVVIGVHIADVSFFVARGSELDREARRRGSSVYFAEGAVHMLPEKLSANLCSLVPDKDRLAMSVMMTVNGACEVTSTSLFPSVVRNRRRFTYSEVQTILDGNGESKFAPMLKEMHRISQRLLKKRQEQGSIDFDIPEPIFRFRNGAIPHEIHPSERLDSHRIVEEFMLLANTVVAEEVPRSGNGYLPFIYRVHDQPPAKDMEKFLEVLSHFRLYQRETTKISAADFRKVLANLEDSPYKALIENLALRTMTKAVYSVDNRGHYGLAFKKYCHFTSPIRRYPDLVVHRMLKDYSLSDKRSRALLSLDALASIAKVSTEAEITAMQAERDYIKVKQLRWLLQHVGERFDGIISGIVSSGFFVELKDTMVEGFVHVDSLEDDYYDYDERELALVGRKWKEKYQLGRPVSIIVRDVILEKRQATFVSTA